MALIVLTEEEASAVRIKLTHENTQFITFGDASHIQHTFCDMIGINNNSDQGGCDCFLTRPDVAEYLKSIGVRYGNNYRVYSESWGEHGNTVGEFVTYLSYYVQAACIMMASDNINHFFALNYIAIDPEYSASILKKKDLYFVNKENTIGAVVLDEFLQHGVDVMYYGKKFSADNKDAYFEMLDLEREASVLTRELDAEVFPADFSDTNILYPYSISFNRFTDSKNESTKDIDIFVRGDFDFDGTYRKYPIHKFYKIDGKWYYYTTNSVKYPTRYEILSETFLEEKVFDYSIQKDLDVSAATEVFALVLDCNEICNARKYWEHVSFVGKYDKENKRIIILDQNQGILEFHNILQDSMDLSADVAPIEVEKDFYYYRELTRRESKCSQ